MHRLSLAVTSSTVTGLARQKLPDYVPDEHPQAVLMP